MKLKRFNKIFEKLEFVEYKKDLTEIKKMSTDVHMKHINIQMDELGEYLKDKGGLRYSKSVEKHCTKYFFVDTYTNLGVVIPVFYDTLHLKSTPKHKFNQAQTGFMINKEFIRCVEFFRKYDLDENLINKIRNYHKTFTYNHTGTNITKNYIIMIINKYDREETKELTEDITLYLDTNRFGL